MGQASSLPFPENSQAESLRHGTKPIAARLISASMEIGVKLFRRFEVCKQLFHDWHGVDVQSDVAVTTTFFSL